MPVSVRAAKPDDAEAIAAIYARIVASTTISFELEPPSVDEMRGRIENTLKTLPWLVSLDGSDQVNGYAYASKHRERAAYQWSVDVTVYVRDDSRGQGVGRALYEVLFSRLAEQGFFQAFAGIALPNSGSIALHEAMGFKSIGVYRNVGFKLGQWRDVSWWQKELRAVSDPFPLKRPSRHS